MERLIDKYLPADYHDTFVLKSRKPAEQIIPKELIKKIFNHSPAWLNFLMKVRNILVKPLGLETGKVLKTEDCIIEDTENEAIMRNAVDTFLYIKTNYLLGHEHQNVSELLTNHFFLKSSSYPKVFFLKSESVYMYMYITLSQNKQCSSYVNNINTTFFLISIYSHYF